MKLSIVIPAYNEAAALPRVLPSLLDPADVEVIVVDGGSRDGTPSIASRHGARVLTTVKSRGAQLDFGARAASGEAILFLHADARPPAEFPQRIAEALSDPSTVLGAFSLRFDAPGGWFRFLERSTAARVALTSTPYGDQGLFMRRADYIRSGGFPHWPLLEDVGMVRRLRRRGRIVVLPDPIVVSARRYRDRGALRTLLRNRLAATLWTLRVPAPAIWAALRIPATSGSPRPEGVPVTKSEGS